MQTAVEVKRVELEWAREGGCSTYNLHYLHVHGAPHLVTTPPPAAGWIGVEKVKVTGRRDASPGPEPGRGKCRRSADDPVAPHWLGPRYGNEYGLE